MKYFQFEVPSNVCNVVSTSICLIETGRTNNLVVNFVVITDAVFTLSKRKRGLLHMFFLIFSQQKARDNRAALRINKVQMSNDSMKRQQQQDSIDPSSRIDSDLFKDPLKQRESEHEQEWKFRQVCCF